MQLGQGPLDGPVHKAGPGRVQPRHPSHRLAAESAENPAGFAHQVGTQAVTDQVELSAREAGPAGQPGQTVALGGNLSVVVIVKELCQLADLGSDWLYSLEPPIRSQLTC